MSTTLKIAGGIVLGFLVLLVGCGLLIDSGTAPETVNEPTEDQGAEQEAEPDDEPPAEQQTAAVGDTLTLEGFEGLRMDVTLESIDEGIAGGEFDQAPEGTEYIGVNLRLENVSEQTYNDSPSNGATLITDSDEQIMSTILLGGECGGDSARIAPGDTRSVCIPYEAPTDTELRLFQFALDSGFSEQGGEWQLD